MPEKQVSTATLERRWVREIRTLAREWGRNYTPELDLTPLEEVRANLYNYLLDNHPEAINVAFRNPIFAPVCTWHIIGRDVKKSLEDRGWILVPNRLDDPTNPFNGKSDLLIRKATIKDDVTYISLEYDLLGPLMDRVERLVRNGGSRLEQISQRRTELEEMLAAKKRATRRKS